MSLSFPMPVPPARLTSGFGSRPSFNAGKYKTGNSHGGQDIAPPTPGQRGYPCVSAGPGRVVATRMGGVTRNEWGNRPVYNAAAGNYVIVEYKAATPFLTAWGIEHFRIWVGYNHLDALSVKVGDYKHTGDRIGIVGDSGAATGTHLHVDVFTDSPHLGNYAFDRRVNPMLVLGRKKAKNPLEDTLSAANVEKILDELNWIKAAIGGSNKGRDKAIRPQLSRIEAKAAGADGAAQWVKQRVGGSVFSGESITGMLGGLQTTDFDSNSLAEAIRVELGDAFAEDVVASLGEILSARKKES